MVLRPARRRSVLETYPLDAAARTASRDGRLRMTAKEAMEIGYKIAEDHQHAVMEMAKHFPEVTLEKLLHGNKVWLAAQIMKAMQSAEAVAINADEGKAP